MPRTPLLTLLAATLLSSALPTLAGADPATAAAAVAGTDRQITYTQWDSGSELRAGSRHGVRVSHGHVVLATTTHRRSYHGTKYDVGKWTSPWTTPGYGVTALIASWSATTPRNSWIEVRARETTGATTGRWQVLGRWASGDRHVQRTSVPAQSGPLGGVDVDTWKAASADGVTGWRLQVKLMRRSGSHAASPSLDTIGAVASRLPAGVPAVSAAGVGRGIVLNVPQYSQMTHTGELALYGGGGEAWCSPTSTSMVLGYYQRLPAPSSYAWLTASAPGPADPWVDAAARTTYDGDYAGTGNWPFNTAYAAGLVGHAFVTRLRSLGEVEQLVAAGIPVAVSVSFGSGALTGAPISSTNGHLIVVVGFTDSGDVVVNDPAASSDAGVRRIYNRGQLESAWLGGSDGTAYVIHDDAPPAAPSSGNW